MKKKSLKNSKMQKVPDEKPESSSVLAEADRQLAEYLATRSNSKRVVKPRLELRVYGTVAG